MRPITVDRSTWPRGLRTGEGVVFKVEEGALGALGRQARTPRPARTGCASCRRAPRAPEPTPTAPWDRPGRPGGEAAGRRAVQKRPVPVRRRRPARPAAAVPRTAGRQRRDRPRDRDHGAPADAGSCRRRLRGDAVAPGARRGQWPVAQREREGQNPLPDGSLREHLLHQVGGELGHATTFAGRTDPAFLAGEGGQAVVSTAIVVHA